MNLELFDGLLNSMKGNEVAREFVKELSNYMEETKKDIVLKQEDCLYQVIELAGNGAYLQNLSNDKASIEEDIPPEILNKITNDYVLRYKDGQYIIEEELTDKFFDSLTDINDYLKIQDKFIKESNIQENAPDTLYKIESYQDDHYVLSYETREKHTIKVPRELISFWDKVGDYLRFKDGDFNRMC